MTSKLDSRNKSRDSLISMTLHVRCGQMKRISFWMMRGRCEAIITSEVAHFWIICIVDNIVQSTGRDTMDVLLLMKACGMPDQNKASAAQTFQGSAPCNRRVPRLRRSCATHKVQPCSFNNNSSDNDIGWLYLVCLQLLAIRAHSIIRYVTCRLPD